MSTAPYSIPNSPDAGVELPLRRFATRDYLQMVEKGVLGADDRVELIGGMIVEMSPAGSRHSHFLSRLTVLSSLRARHS